MEDDDLFTRGLALFNSRDFFSCHEVWEDLWSETRGPSRLFYQGLIQIAVAYYHALNGNYRGATHQFEKGISKLTPYQPAYHGIALTPLLEICAANLTVCSGILEAGYGEFRHDLIPTINVQR
jgi:uncharacterized protein